MQNIRFLLIDIANGLRHLHQNHIVHRDIKPSNIMVTNDEEEGIKYVIIDQGISRDPHTVSGIPKAIKVSAADYDGRLTPIGTKAFMGPEVHLSEKLFGRDSGSTYGYENDTWALGTTAYIAATGKLPFRENTGNFFDNGLGAVKSSLPTFDKGMPPDLVELLSACFEPNPAKRISVDLILLHPFIQDPDGVMSRYLAHLRGEST